MDALEHFWGPDLRFTKTICKDVWNLKLIWVQAVGDRNAMGMMIRSGVKLISSVAEFQTEVSLMQDAGRTPVLYMGLWPRDSVSPTIEIGTHRMILLQPDGIMRWIEFYHDIPISARIMGFTQLQPEMSQEAFSLLSQLKCGERTQAVLLLMLRALNRQGYENLSMVEFDIYSTPRTSTGQVCQVWFGTIVSYPHLIGVAELKMAIIVSRRIARWLDRNY